MMSDLKPTSLIQISQRQIAIATGFLNDDSCIEIRNIFTGAKVSDLKGHSDMIDSMAIVDISKYTQNKK